MGKLFLLNHFGNSALGVKNMSKNKKKKSSKDEEVIKAYKGDVTNIKSDVNGSYTGITENGEIPEQDADDL
jgi:hypothetical protein